MATTNFWTMRNFDIWAALEPDDEEDIQAFYEFAYDDLNDFLDVEKLNDELEFHSVVIHAGYYSGYQIWVDELEDIRGFDDEDAAYWYGMPLREVRDAFWDEVARIRDWLNEKCPAAGMKKLRCVGIFNDGSAVYEYAA